MAAESGSNANAALVPLPKDKDVPPETKGWLFKWTNYIKGYQKRWFVLANGLLSYYRSQAEMAHTCRGTISLHGAHIQIEDVCNFMVSNGGGTQTFHLRASSEVERQRWVTALEFAKAKAIQRMESEEDEIADDAPLDMDKQELVTIVKTLANKLEDLQTCHDLIVRHGHALQRSLADLETLNQGLAKESSSKSSDSGTLIKGVNERATLFKITSNAMINASSEFLELCQGHGKKWQKVLNNEREIRKRMEDMVEQLARQHSHLEAMVRKEYADHHHSEGSVPPVGSAGVSSSHHTSDNADRCHARSPTSNSTCSDDEEIFEDAMGDEEVHFTVSKPPGHRRTSSEESSAARSSSSHLDDYQSDDDDDYEDGETRNQTEQFSVVQRISIVQRRVIGVEQSNETTTNDTDKTVVAVKNGASAESSPDAEDVLRPLSRSLRRSRRQRIPDKPNISFSLWSIMKNCIGKDLSKIPVPVNFSEPLSMLQRLVEDFEYSEILDRAAQCSDNCEQMAYVAAFTVSSYSTTAIRTGKPFNPLLGETYECDRSDDKRWKCISEQVSHHPPMVAQFCESSDGTWRCWQEFTMRSKFKGKYLEVEPLGIAHLEFTNTGNHYTWRKVKTVVHNIVIGKLWIDQTGEMEIINHKTGDKCHMKFEPYSYFGGIAKKVTGTIITSDEKVEFVLNGTWDTKLEASKVIGESRLKGKSSLEVGPSRTLWKVTPLDPEAENYYNFSRFACELNEEEVGVAPTDSRLRPDQRMMENGEWDAANDEKVRLEEKQRAARRQKELEAEQAASEGLTPETYQPIWFHKVTDEQNGGKLIHVYRGGYWDSKQKQEWSKCPDIF